MIKIAFGITILVAALVLSYHQLAPDPTFTRKKRAPLKMYTTPITECIGQKTLALTLDGDITHESMLFHLPNLAAKNYSATMHVIVDYEADEEKKDLYRNIAQQHTLGIHWSLGNPLAFSLSEIQQKIIDDAIFLHNVTGFWPRYVRLSSESLRFSIIALLEELGYVVTSCSLDNYVDNCKVDTFLYHSYFYNNPGRQNANYIIRHSLSCKGGYLYYMGLFQTSKIYRQNVVSLQECIGSEGKYNEQEPIKVDLSILQQFEDQDKPTVSSAKRL